ncbi:MAG: tetratricopeptide repeat protein [Candidatus Thorarchaeota archaeon]
MEKGNYDLALAALDELDAEDELEGLILKGRILERKGEISLAVEIAELALQETEANGTDFQVLQALISLSYARLRKRGLSELSKLLKRGEQRIQEVKDLSKNALKPYQASLAYLNGCEEYLNGDIHSSIEYLDKSLILRQALPSRHDIVETMTALGFVHIYGTGKANLALDYFTQSLFISEELGNSTAIAHSLNRLGVYYHETRKYDEALSHFEKSLAIYQELDNPVWIAGLSNNISLIYRVKENYDLALNYLEKALASHERLGDEGGLGIVLANIGFIYGFKGDTATAITYLQRSLDVREKSGQKLATAWSLLYLADAHVLWSADLGLALDYTNKSIAICEETGSDLGKAWAFNKLSIIYNLQGELELALDKVQAAQTIFTRIDHKGGIADSYAILGLIHRNLGKFDLAMKNLESSAKLMKEITVGANLALWLSFFLIHLVLIAQNLDDIILGQKYLIQLKELQQESQSKYVDLRSRLAEGIVLKMSDRAAKKFQAQQLFEQIVDGEVLDINLTVLAILNLCELLILEMQYSKKPEEMLNQITSLSQKFSQIAERQQSSALIVMAQLLGTKLSMVNQDFEEASRLLSSAKELASEKKLGSLLTQVKSEQEAVQAEIDRLDDLILRKTSIHERIKRARVSNWLVEAKKIQGAWVRPSAELSNQ